MLRWVCRPYCEVIYRVDLKVCEGLPRSNTRTLVEKCVLLSTFKCKMASQNQNRRGKRDKLKIKPSAVFRSADFSTPRVIVAWSFEMTPVMVNIRRAETGKGMKIQWRANFFWFRCRITLPVGSETTGPPFILAIGRVRLCALRMFEIIRKPNINMIGNGNRVVIRAKHKSDMMPQVIVFE